MRRQEYAAGHTHARKGPVMDIYANTEDRDLGGVARGIQKIVKLASQHMPAGIRIDLAGQVQKHECLGELGADKKKWKPRSS